MSEPISKTYIGIIDGVPTYSYIFASAFDGEPFRVVGPDPLGPIDPSQSVRWVNRVGTYTPKDQRDTDDNP